MITADDIVALAQSDAKTDDLRPIPDMGVVEQVLYWQMYYLCKMYNEGKVSADFCRKRKTEYLTEYGRMGVHRANYITHARRLPAFMVELQAGVDSGCEHCKKAMAIYDGREVLRDG